MEKGLIESLVRSVKSNGHLSTISYIVKKLSMLDGFFFVDISVFGRLVPRQK